MASAAALAWVIFRLSGNDLDFSRQTWQRLRGDKLKQLNHLLALIGAYDLSLPWFTSFSWIFALFAAGLVGFHILLIFAVPLGTIGWKRVDYIWLSMALLGLLGAVGGSREFVARNMFDLETHSVKSTRQFVEHDAEFGTGPAVCRDFVRSEFSPPPEEFDRLQRGYNAQCEWFKNAASILRSLQDGGTVELDAAKLFGPVPSDGDRQIYQFFLNDITAYNATLAGAQKLQQQAKLTEIESTVRLLGPALVALALALRMTKVTAEIKSERKKNES